MRTLLRPGLKGALVKIDGRGGPRFFVAGPGDGDRSMFFDVFEAERSFADIENGRAGAEDRGKLTFAERLRRPFRRGPKVHRPIVS